MISRQAAPRGGHKSATRAVESWAGAVALRRSIQRARNDAMSRAQRQPPRIGSFPLATPANSKI
jgi:hypothetical protein